MTATPSIDLSGWLSEQLTQASPDLLRAMLTTFVQALMAPRPTRSAGRLRRAQRGADEHS